MEGYDWRPLVGAVDQGTSSSRFLIFDSSTGELVTFHQTAVKQVFPHEGWVEVDPFELLATVRECIQRAVENLKALGIDPASLCTVGITNQRETTVAWDRLTGKPLYNALVWQDMRTADIVDSLQGKAGASTLRPRCGLPLSTYFSAVKIKWLISNSEAVQEAMKHDTCLFGTVDSWLLWNFTGGIGGGRHITDVTNASRTMLMNIHDLKWDPVLCKFFDIPMKLLPEICSSSEIYGCFCDGPLENVPISGVLGDQQAALVGQGCMQQGCVKNTYGTGCFLLYNTGTVPVDSSLGLLTTVAYQLGHNAPVFYALEGSVAVAGAAVQWLRDNLGLIPNAAAIEDLAGSVENTHGCYFVPAFSGLFCPYWQPHARGLICGLSQYTSRAHIARACLEAVCFQTREVLEAMNAESRFPLTRLQVDGGMTANSLLMQLQADILGIPVVRPAMHETTALGAAIAAGCAKGIEVWDVNHTASITTDTFTPSATQQNRDRRYYRWKNAVQRSMNWDTPQAEETTVNIQRSLPGGLFVLGAFGIYMLADYLASR